MNFIDLEQLGIGGLNFMPRQIWVDASEDWSVLVEIVWHCIRNCVSSNFEFFFC